MNVEFHSDADKAAAVAAEGEEKGAMHRLTDVDVDWSSTQRNWRFFFLGYYYHHRRLLAKRHPRTTVADSRPIDISHYEPGPESCRIDYSITHFWLSFVFQCTLSYGEDVGIWVCACGVD